MPSARVAGKDYSRKLPYGGPKYVLTNAAYWPQIETSKEDGMQIITMNTAEPEKLEAVKASMESMGAPTIKAVWLEGYNAWMALEGSHRLVAAKELGLVPEIEEVEFDADVRLSDLECKDFAGDDYSIEELAEYVAEGINRGERLILNF